MRKKHIDRLVQDCSNSIANALELLQSCTKPSISCDNNRRRIIGNSASYKIEVVHDSVFSQTPRYTHHIRHQTIWLGDSTKTDDKNIMTAHPHENTFCITQTFCMENSPDFATQSEWYGALVSVWKSCVTKIQFLCNHFDNINTYENMKSKYHMWKFELSSGIGDSVRCRNDNPRCPPGTTIKLGHYKRSSWWMQMCWR